MEVGVPALKQLHQKVIDTVGGWVINSAVDAWKEKGGRRQINILQGAMCVRHCYAAN